MQLFLWCGRRGEITLSLLRERGCDSSVAVLSALDGLSLRPPGRTQAQLFVREWDVKRFSAAASRTNDDIEGDKT